MNSKIGLILISIFLVMIFSSCTLINTNQPSISPEITNTDSQDLIQATETTGIQEPTQTPVHQTEQEESIDNSGPVPVIWDDDGSPDGVVALMYLLQHPDFEIKALTVSHGEAYPSKFVEKLPDMLARLGLEGIPVAAGREEPLEGENKFPESWREPTNQFWWLYLPQSDQNVEEISAAQLIVDTVNASPVPVLIFISGSHSNLVDALRLDPGIKENILKVAIMGGAVKVNGNLHEAYPEMSNVSAEWNIWIDYAAADEVFSAGLPVFLTPLDATNQVPWTRTEVSKWESPNSPESLLAVELENWVFDSMNTNSSYIWDLVAAVFATNPDLCQSEDHHISVITDSGPEQGRTVADPDQISNSTVCMKPDIEMMKKQVLDIFTGQITSSEPLTESEEEDESENVFELSGTWVGMIESQTNDFRDELTLIFFDQCDTGEVCGNYQLSDSGCRGELTLESFDENQYVFMERLIEGSEYCLEDGTEILKLIENDMLTYYFEKDLGDSLAISTGTLTKE